METKIEDSKGMSDEHSIRRSAGISDLVKIRFALSPDDQAAGVEAENLWAESLGGDRYRIDNIPFYVYGISLDDVVRAEESDGRLDYCEVASRRGHSTYRVLVKDSEGFNRKDFEGLWRKLEDLGCSHEIARARWMAIDVPPATNVSSVYRVLESGEEQGVWTFEEGHCGHSV